MKAHRSHALALASALLLTMLPVPIARAGGDTAGDVPSWPEFHGPGRTNISPEKGLLKKWPDGGPQLVWKYSSCGQGFRAWQSPRE